MKIYISIPITGHDEAVQRRKARMWQRYFESMGHIVINPFQVADELKQFHRETRKKEPTYREYMDADLCELYKCSHIFFINGWSESKGCIEEAEEAIFYGVNVLFERTFV